MRNPGRSVWCHSGVAAGDVEPKRPWDALQLHRPNLGECHVANLRKGRPVGCSANVPTPAEVQPSV
jgi:hypothetical protein